jgi:hypothetical protein
MYWLITNNYLLPHKQYYDTKKEAFEALRDMIALSEKTHKKALKKTWQNSIVKNCNETHTAILKARYDAFKGYSEMQLEGSCQLVEVEEVTDKMMKIFTIAPYEEEKEEDVCCKIG